MKDLGAYQKCDLAMAMIEVAKLASLAASQSQLISFIEMLFCIYNGSCPQRPSLGAGTIAANNTRTNHFLSADPITGSSKPIIGSGARFHVPVLTIASRGNSRGANRTCRDELQIK
jgi:hypothetical protein